MSNFLYLFKGGRASYNNLSKEENQKHSERWTMWMGALKEKGQLVDGRPLSEEGIVIDNKGDIVTNGPFVEGTEVIGGYLIIEAGDLKEATHLLQGCPHFDHKESSVEVREITSM